MNPALHSVSSCSNVLRVTVDSLAGSVSAREPISHESSSFSVNFYPLTGNHRCEAPTAWCHACACDNSGSLWTLASAREGREWVLMCLKGTLSKQSNQLERISMYKMQLPKNFLSEVSDLSFLRYQLLPRPAQDSLTLEERRERMKVSSMYLDRWFDNPAKGTAESTFTSDVAIIRHVTDFSSGIRRTECYGMDTLKQQTPSDFGRRSKHTLAETSIPEHYMTFLQSYELAKDNEGRSWRQSSLRIRVYDPNNHYKLRLGIIFYSDKDELPQTASGFRRQGSHPYPSVAFCLADSNSNGTAPSPHGSEGKPPQFLVSRSSKKHKVAPGTEVITK